MIQFRLGTVGSGCSDGCALLDLDVGNNVCSNLDSGKCRALGADMDEAIKAPCDEILSRFGFEQVWPQWRLPLVG